MSKTDDMRKRREAMVRGRAEPAPPVVEFAELRPLTEEGIRKMGVRGRPRQSGEERLPLTVKVTGGERGALRAKADRAGLPLSVWAREVLLREAGKGGLDE
jgi:hypothetical protein